MQLRSVARGEVSFIDASRFGQRLLRKFALTATGRIIGSLDWTNYRTATLNVNRMPDIRMAPRGKPPEDVKQG